MKSRMLLIILLVTAVYSHAGITVTEKLIDGESVSYYQKGLIASYSDGKPDTLIDIPNKTVYTMDYESEIIMYGTFNDMKEMQKLAANKIQDLSKDEFYKKQHEEIKKMNVITDLKGSGKYAGFSCERVFLHIDHQDVSTEICYSKDLLDEISKEVDMNAFFKIVNNTPLFFMSADELIESEAVLYTSKGYSLYEKKIIPDFSGKNKAEISEVISVKKGEIPASVFKLPPNLTRVKMKDLMSQIVN